MPTPPVVPSRTGAEDHGAELVGHPRGTLAIVLIFGVLFAAGWFAMFLSRFMGQGALHH
jgi:hypothetical protein